MTIIDLDPYPVQARAAVGLDGIRENPRTHLLVGTQFGDLEFDVGKVVPWASQFFSDTFIADSNSGKPRYWVVDWSVQTPYAKYTTLSGNFFADPVNWRKAQFAAADRAWSFNDNDWVFFMDGTECLCTDEANPPDDLGASPYKSWIDREIQRCKDLDENSALIPFFVFLRQDNVSKLYFKYLTDEEIASVNYSSPDMDPMYGYAEMDSSPSFYYPFKGLRRLVKVSEIRDPGFDWSSIDTPDDYIAGPRIQIISYAYASWKPLDYDVVNHTGVVEGADLGLKMRSFISQVRPVPDLIGNSMIGEALGPYLSSDGNTVFSAPGDPEANCLTTPAYPALFRSNLRDGVFYLENERGNVPMVWDPETLSWIPALDPYDWKKSGTDPTLFEQG